MLAALGGQPQIDAAGIEEAWADLQQLPLPLHEPPALAAKAGTTGSAIEFGQLDEGPSVQPPEIGPDVADAAVAKLDAISRSLDALQFAPPGGGTASSGRAGRLCSSSRERH